MISLEKESQAAAPTNAGVEATADGLAACFFSLNCVS
jgi:hypothetical protein